MPAKGGHQSEEAKARISLAHRGRHHSKEHVEKIARKNRTKHRSEEFKQRMRQKLVGQKYGKKGSESPAWKGDKVGYYSLHRWIRENWPSPELCQMCNIKKAYDLANITGIYNRDFSNWQYLCRRCHLIRDGTINNLKLRWAHI